MEHQLPNSNKDFIESLIPQRSPFVMVDQIYDYSDNQVISGLMINENHIFAYKGFFQASGLMEHQAQSVALHTGYKFFLLGKQSPTGYIGAIKSFEAFNLPKIGDQLISEVSILNEMMGVTLVEIITKVNDTIIAKSQMKTVVK